MKFRSQGLLIQDLIYRGNQVLFDCSLPLWSLDVIRNLRFTSANYHPHSPGIAFKNLKVVLQGKHEHGKDHENHPCNNKVLLKILQENGWTSADQGETWKFESRSFPDGVNVWQYISENFLCSTPARHLHTKVLPVANEEMVSEQVDYQVPNNKTIIDEQVTYSVPYGQHLSYSLTNVFFSFSQKQEAEVLEEVPSMSWSDTLDLQTTMLLIDQTVVAGLREEKALQDEQEAKLCEKKALEDAREAKMIQVLPKETNPKASSKRTLQTPVRHFQARIPTSTPNPEQPSHTRTYTRILGEAFFLRMSEEE